MILKDNFYHITAQTHAEGESDYRIQLNPHSAVFQAHFPEEPIMPGACMVQMVHELAGLSLRHTLTMCKIGQLKFLKIVNPDQTPELSVNLIFKPQPSGETQVSARFEDEGTTYSKMSIIFHYA